MTVRYTLPSLLLAVLLLAACGRGNDGDDAVIARVGEEVITVAEFELEMARRSEGRSRFFQAPEHRRELLEDMIRHRMLVQEARDEGIADEPEFRALVERMLIQRLREKRLDERLAEQAPTDEAVQDYYEANRDAFTRPARRQVAMIRVDAPSSLDEDERQARLEHIESARLAAGELSEATTHFGEVAVAYSDDRSSRYQGGIVGWLVDGDRQRYQWPDAVVDAAFELREPGAMTDVIDADQAYYLVRLADYQPGRTQPLEQVADGIRHRMMRERARSLEGELFAQIEEKRTSTIDEAALSGVEPPSQVDSPPAPEQKPPAMPVDPGEQ